MPLGDTPILDDFERTDSESIGANWSDRGMRIIDGALAPSNAYGWAMWTALGPVADCEVHASVTSSGGSVLLFVRVASDAFSQGYAVEVAAGSRFVSVYSPTGTPVSGNLLRTALAARDRIGLRCVGDTITVWHTPISTGVLTTVAEATSRDATGAGYIGAMAETTDCRFWDFGGGEIRTSTPARRRSMLLLGVG